MRRGCGTAITFSHCVQMVFSVPQTEQMGLGRERRLYKRYLGEAWAQRKKALRD